MLGNFFGVVGVEGSAPAGVTNHPGKLGAIGSSIKRQFSKFAGLMIGLSITTAAFGQLHRVGPVSDFGFPGWYQDGTGVALEFCTPLNQAELTGGWCVMLPGDIASAPENANNFAAEHFYFLANAAGDVATSAKVTAATSAKAKLVLALEATGPDPALVFARIRAVVTGLKPGDYIVKHPYGEIPVTVTDKNNKIFVTQDIGINCAAGQFDCALAGGIGPFLLAADRPGGTELPAISGPAPGKLYLADPTRLGPVTGGTKRNEFSVEDANGQPILVNTSGVPGPITDFTLNGRLVQGTIAGRVNVDQAIYTAGNNSKRVDVFASVSSTLPARVPSGAKLTDTIPALVYSHGSCSTTGASSNPMTPGADGAVWGQSKVSATDEVPTLVCVKDATSSAVYEIGVTDQVIVTGATYAGGTLTITAKSSDTTGAPNVLTAVLGSTRKDLSGGTATFSSGDFNSPNFVPPSKIVVTSAKGGRGEARVVTSDCDSCPTGTTAPPPASQNQSVTTPAGTSLTINIPNARGNLIQITPVSLSKGVSFSAPSDGSGLSDGTIIYTVPAGTPAATDSFTFTLSALDGQPSPPATVTVTITSGSTPPAVNSVETITINNPPNYRNDQFRWTVSGTDFMVDPSSGATTPAVNRVITLNMGSQSSAPGTMIGTAVVDATGAWTVDVRGQGKSPQPKTGDTVIATSDKNATSAPSAPVSIRK